MASQGPLQTQLVEVVFEGLAENDNRLLRQPGKLDDCVNVQFDKVGRMNKRRGYVRIDIATDTHGLSNEQVFSNVATFDGELVVVGLDHLYSVHVPVGVVSGNVGLVDGASCTRRGPVLRGNYRVQHVESSRT